MSEEQTQQTAETEAPRREYRERGEGGYRGERGGDRGGYRGGDRGGAGGERRGFRPRRRKQKVSKFDEWGIEDINYKDVERLKEFLSEHGKILSRRVTGNRAKHQRRLTRSVKRARFMALLPYVGKIEKTHHHRGDRHHDRHHGDREHRGYRPSQPAPEAAPAAEVAVAATAEE